MTGDELRQLIKLAQFTRCVFERMEERHNRPNDLRGLCYEASLYLYNLAKAHGITVEIGRGTCHWFVLYGDTVVDVTSTQFGHPERVAVLPLEKAEGCGSWWHLQGKESPLADEVYYHIASSADREVGEMGGFEAVFSAAESI